jgi:CDGSH-type Zn-finger protein/uncharacterized Fe-S cluster protein YjdI
MPPKTFSSEHVDVQFDASRCIHAGRCVKGLPGVFDVKARPWVQPGNAEVDAVVAVVQTCPTGALTYTRKDGGAAEAGDERNTVRIAADGPLEFRGRLAWEGRTLTRASLCRCGASANKPFCDNAHKGVGFTDDGLPDEGEIGDAGVGGSLACAAFKNGPLHVTGGVEVLAADGEVIFRGEEAFFCRCGASSNKPFCDSTHTRIGFEG